MIPEGTRFLLPPEARFRAEVMDRLQALFARYGYERVELPALELYDPAHPLAGRAFKLVDKTGEVLALRSEFTTALARLLRAHPRFGVVRYQYAGTLWLREADAEVLHLALEALSALGVEAVLEVGLPALVGELLFASGLPEGVRAALQGAVHRKNLPELSELLSAHPVPPPIREALLALPDLYGGKEVLEEAKRLPLPPRAQAALRGLEKTLELLERPVLLDLGMARRFEYYSGIFFRAYTPGFGLPLLGGGRYDGALLPMAAGFALGVERLLEALRPSPEESPPEVLALDLKALRLFARERQVELFHGEDPLAYARARGIPYLAEGERIWRVE